MLDVLPLYKRGHKRDTKTGVRRRAPVVIFEEPIIEREESPLVSSCCSSPKLFLRGKTRLSSRQRRYESIWTKTQNTCASFRSSLHGSRTAKIPRSVVLVTCTTPKTQTLERVRLKIFESVQLEHEVRFKTGFEPAYLQVTLGPLLAVVKSPNGLESSREATAGSAACSF